MEQDLNVYRVRERGVALVGSLGSDGSFAYDQEYLTHGDAMPLSHSLPVRKAVFSAEEARPYFEGLLPEGEPRRLAAAVLHVRESDYVAILGAQGFDCIGDVGIGRCIPQMIQGYDPVAPEELAALLLQPELIAQENGANRLSLAGTQDKVGLAHSWSLAPAYDLVCTTWFPDLSREMGVVLGGVHDIGEVDPGCLIRMSRELGVPSRRFASLCHELAETVGAAIDRVVSAGAPYAKEYEDDIAWKAEDLAEDIEPRRQVLLGVR